MDEYEKDVSDQDDEMQETELEKEYRLLVEEVQEEIDEYISQASAALDKAVELANKHGVSFYSQISFLGQNYRTTLPKKFTELDPEFVDGITGTYSEYGDTGWAHSAVC